MTAVDGGGGGGDGGQRVSLSSTRYVFAPPLFGFCLTRLIKSFKPVSRRGQQTGRGEVSNGGGGRWQRWMAGGNGVAASR